MEGKSIHLRISDEMLKEFNSIKGSMGFSNIQEFIKDAMRKAVLEYRRHAAMRTIKKLQGSCPNARHITTRERNKLAKQFFEEKEAGRDIFKEYGLK
ncbi:MAG: ribbon-helix-helix domain-containing protein [Candidatus Nanoarchaeia archaeon]|nr:ribbon-helix-helix domain-containing protein [Candidatus Nanoarchaeia archaeon]